MAPGRDHCALAVPPPVYMSVAGAFFAWSCPARCNRLLQKHHHAGGSRRFATLHSMQERRFACAHTLRMHAQYPLGPRLTVRVRAPSACASAPGGGKCANLHRHAHPYHAPVRLNASAEQRQGVLATRPASGVAGCSANCSTCRQCAGQRWRVQRRWQGRQHAGWAALGHDRVPSSVYDDRPGRDHTATSTGFARANLRDSGARPERERRLQR